MAEMVEPLTVLEKLAGAVTVLKTNEVYLTTVVVATALVVSGDPGVVCSGTGTFGGTVEGAAVEETAAEETAVEETAAVFVMVTVELLEGEAVVSVEVPRDAVAGQMVVVLSMTDVKVGQSVTSGPQEKTVWTRVE